MGGGCWPLVGLVETRGALVWAERQKGLEGAVRSVEMVHRGGGESHSDLFDDTGRQVCSWSNVPKY